MTGRRLSVAVNAGQIEHHHAQVASAAPAGGSWAGAVRALPKMSERFHVSASDYFNSWSRDSRPEITIARDPNRPVINETSRVVRRDHHEHRHCALVGIPDPVRNRTAAPRLSTANASGRRCCAGLGRRQGLARAHALVARHA